MTAPYFADPAGENGADQYGFAGQDLVSAPGAAPSGAAPATSNMLDRIIARFKGQVQGNTPAGLENVLRPDQIEAARPSLFQTVFNKDASGAFRKNLSDAVQGVQIAPQLAQKKRYQDIQGQLAQQFAPPTDHKETAEELRDRAAAMYVEGARLGADPLWLKDLNEFAKEAIKVPKVVPDKIEHINMGDHVGFFMPGGTKEIASLPINATPEHILEFKARIAESQANRESSNMNSSMVRAGHEATAFATENTKLKDSAQRYSNFKNAVSEAKLGNPAAYKTVLLNFMNSESSQSPQARLGMLQYLSQVDPSIKGNFEIAMQRAASGKFPPAVLANLEKIIEGVHQRNAALYEQRRSERVSRNPLLEGLIPTTGSIFNTEGMMAPAGGAATPASGSRIAPMRK